MLPGFNNNENRLADELFKNFVLSSNKIMQKTIFHKKTMPWYYISISKVIGKWT